MQIFSAQLPQMSFFNAQLITLSAGRGTAMKESITGNADHCSYIRCHEHWKLLETGTCQ